MLPVQSLLPFEQLVPRERFGALLHRRRRSTRETLAGLARMSSGRFLPDELIAIERGERTIGDSTIVALSVLYGLEDRPIPRPSELALVLDRGAAVDVSNHSRRSACASAVDDSDEAPIDPPLAVAARFVAVAVLAGIDLQSGVDGFGLLAEVLEMAVGETGELLDHIMGGQSVNMAEVVASIGGSVIVAQAGILIGRTAVGQLLLAPRPGTPGTGPRAPAAGPLSDLIDRIATPRRADQP